MAHTIELPTSHGIVKATWDYSGRDQINVHFGGRMTIAKASAYDVGNDLIAKDIVRAWINVDEKGDAQ